MFSPDSRWLSRFRRSLKAWYTRQGRDLPWRRTRDPYAVWVSEIMLQQTTVRGVIPFFERFLERFPSVQALANAPESDVLRAWEGLGYYRRARNLHRAARMLVDEFAGQLPAGVEQLRRLPGIGRYTAGAIASFAYDQAAPILEANTARLYCRLMGYRGDPASTAGRHRLWEFARQLVPQRSPGAFNHALIDLGATVCTPRDPACERCPVRTCCTAFREGLVESIPRATRRPEITPVVEAALAIPHRGRWLLRRCGDGERWAGLWDFPRFRVDVDERPFARLPHGPWNGSTADPLPTAIRRELENRLQQATGIRASVERPLLLIRHAVTRYRITLVCLQARRIGGRRCNGEVQTAWVSPRRFDEYPLSVTGRKLARHLVRCRSSST